MAHPLKHFRDANEIGIGEFASRIGVSRQSIHRIEIGGQKPSLELVRKIMSETRGVVTGVDLRPDLFSADVVQSFSKQPRRSRQASSEVAL